MLQQINKLLLISASFLIILIQCSKIEKREIIYEDFFDQLKVNITLRNDTKVQTEEKQINDYYDYYDDYDDFWNSKEFLKNDNFDDTINVIRNKTIEITDLLIKSNESDQVEFPNFNHKENDHIKDNYLDTHEEIEKIDKQSELIENENDQNTEDKLRNPNKEKVILFINKTDKNIGLLLAIIFVSIIIVIVIFGVVLTIIWKRHLIRYGSRTLLVEAEEAPCNIKNFTI